MLDEFGQCLYVVDGKIKDTPRVTQKVPTHTALTMLNHLPEVAVTCSCCKKNIELSILDKVTISSERIITKLDNYIGQSLKNFAKAYEQRTDRVYFFSKQFDIIHNDEDWSEEMPEYIVKLGDEAAHNTVVYTHKECYEKQLEEETKRYLITHHII